VSKVVWQFDSSSGPSLYTINEAVHHFYTKTKVKPSVVRLSLDSTMKLMGTLFNQPAILILEQDKKYAHYINTVCGPIMLDLLEEDPDISFGVSNASLFPTPQSFLVVENNEIDKQFEKHILNSGDK
jgi:hypothetical protein